MPASLSEAFRSPNNDNSSSYTRSSLDSLKNPQFNANASSLQGGSPYMNTTPSMYNAPSSFSGYPSLSNESRMINTRNNGSPNSVFPTYQNGGCMEAPRQNLQMANADTASLISSINSDQFNDEVEQIRRKYNIDEEAPRKSNEQTCDMSIYHILSCSKCRKRLKKLFRDDDNREDELCERKRRRHRIDDDDMDDDFDDIDGDISRKKKRRSQTGGGIDFNELFKGNMHSFLLYVISGIFLILLLDFFMRFGRLRG